jgi:hypothetical protein
MWTKFSKTKRVKKKTLKNKLQKNKKNEQKYNIFSKRNEKLKKNIKIMNTIFLVHVD